LDGVNEVTETETTEITLPMEWRQPYADLDVFRLHIGPFYAGEVARTLRAGWKASSPISPRIISHPTKEAAQQDIESVVRNLS
jgi:hypothetical protein